MRNSKWLLGGLLCLGSVLAAHAENFTLTSPATKTRNVLAEKYVYQGFGCHGGNLSPALQWKNPPAGTQSFAVTVYDPDAPTGSGWWHWVVYNLPANTRGLPEGAGDANQPRLPEEAIQAKTDFGNAGYGGACPPAGDKAHRYIFKVHALKVAKLDVPADASPALVGFALHANQLSTASFTVKYRR